MHVWQKLVKKKIVYKIALKDCSNNMKTDIKHLAAFAAVAIWADGEYDEAEKIALEEIAEAFELDADALKQEVEVALTEIEPKNEDELNDYIYAHSVEIDDDEAEMIFEALAEIVLIDGVLSSDEVNNLMSMATALGIDDSRAILMLVDMAKEEEDIVIEF